MGPRFVGDEFETPVYRVDGGVYYQTTFAYWRHRDRDLAVHPGQDIEHVVDDNEKSTRDRVDLPMRKSGLTTPHTTRRSWFELSSALSPLGEGPNGYSSGTCRDPRDGRDGIHIRWRQVIRYHGE